MDLIHPHTTTEVADALRDLSERRILTRVVGGRLHTVAGADPGAELWTTLLDRVVAYDPAEMLCVVEGGMRLHDLRTLLRDGGQEWPVDEPEDATVGGVIAADVALPRQLRVGPLRDTVVEMSFVSGDGRVIRTGARTVKNVTGFDLHRLLTGSFGTLGLIAQVAVKVRPLPKVSRIPVTREGGVELAERLLDAIPLPAAVVAEHDRVLVHLEGWPDEVAEQVAAAGAVAVMAEHDPGTRRALPFRDSPTVVRAAVPPSRVGALVEGRTRFRALVGVGFVWVPCADAAEIETTRSRAHDLGGTAPVVHGTGDRDMQGSPLPEVQRKIRSAFDPATILVAG